MMKHDINTKKERKEMRYVNKDQGVISLLFAWFLFLQSFSPNFPAPQCPSWSRLSPGAKVCLTTCKVCMKR